MFRYRLGGLTVWIVLVGLAEVVRAEPGGAAESAALVERLKADPMAMDLIRKDGDLLERINRRPTLMQVLREIRNDPSVFWYRVGKTLRDPWVIFGFGAQALFLMRFLVQWIASERRKRSHIPVAFWYFSLAGGITLFAYAVRRFDPVFALGQGLGCFIYIRNLVLIGRRSAEYRDRLSDRANGRSGASESPASADSLAP